MSGKHHSRLGKEILPNTDLADVTDQQVRQLKRSIWEHGVIVVRNQKLTASQLKDLDLLGMVMDTRTKQMKKTKLENT